MKFFLKIVFLGVLFLFESCASSPYTKKWQTNFPLSNYEQIVPTKIEKSVLKEKIKKWLNDDSNQNWKEENGILVVFCAKKFESNGNGWSVLSNFYAEMRVKVGDGEVLIFSQNERAVPYSINGKYKSFGEMRNERGFSGEYAEQIRKDAAETYSFLCDVFESKIAQIAKK